MNYKHTIQYVYKYVYVSTDNSFEFYYSQVFKATVIELAYGE